MIRNIDMLSWSLAVFLAIVANVIYMRASRGDQLAGTEIGLVLLSVIAAIGSVVALYPVAGGPLMHALDNALPSQGSQVHLITVAAVMVLIAGTTMLGLLLPGVLYSRSGPQRQVD